MKSNHMIKKKKMMLELFLINRIFFNISHCEIQAVKDCLLSLNFTLSCKKMDVFLNSEEISATINVLPSKF